MRRTLANQPVVNDDDTVIAGWCEHVLCTSLSLGATPIVDGRTQCMPLSAAVVNRRSAGRKRGTQSMLVLTVTRARRLRCHGSDCSTLCCGPERDA